MERARSRVGGAEVGGAATLVGRDREHDLLRAGLEAAVGGAARAFLLRGEAGMGKSSLAEAFSEEARNAGAVVAWGHCLDAADTPSYWPWMQALRDLAAEFGDDPLRAAIATAGPTILTLLPHTGEAMAITEPRVAMDESPFALFDGVGLLLGALAHQSPLVVVLDDIHVADEPSLLLFRFLARTLRGQRIVLLGTYDPDQARSRRQIHGLIAEIARDVNEISLRGLEERETTTLYERLTGTPPPETLAVTVYKASEGNPFFVQETVRLLMEKGELHRPDFSVGFRVPAGIRELVRRRVVPLSIEAQGLLSVASVIGRTFDITLLQAVAGGDGSELLDRLEEATAAGILEESSASGRFTFTHILMREALYEEVPISQRMQIHRKVALAIEDLHRADLGARTAELAHHWFKAAQAGDPNKTLEYSVRAGEQAMESGAFGDAMHLYHRALKAAEQTGADRTTRERLSAQLQEAQAAEDEARAKAPAGGMVEVPASGSITESSFRREGEYWTIEFAGRTARVRHVKGLLFISRLLAQPGEELHVLDLAALEVSREPRSISRGSAAQAGLSPDSTTGFEVLDSTAKAMYKRRLLDLQEDLEEARDRNDAERAALVQLEIDALEHELRAALGLGGRDRKTGSAAERARVNVTKTIKDALKRLEQAHPELSRHLATTLRTGTYCSYRPDSRLEIRWDVG